MADFKIQSGRAEAASGSTTVTITAGVDYTAPASATKAFVRIVGIHHAGEGNSGSDFNPWGRNAFWITNPANLLTSITFARGEATGVAAALEWEIVEYVGAGGGAHEFVVRHTEVLELLANTDTVKDTSSVSGVVTDGDVVAFITGQAHSDSTGARAEARSALHTAAWISASQVARLTRGSSFSYTSKVSVAVVEFTGSAWSVQRIEHTHSAAGAENETISDVGATSRAFTHTQFRCNANTGTGYAARTQLTSTTNLELALQASAGIASQVTVVWVVANSQTGTGAMNVQRGTGSRSSAGSDPDTWTESVTGVGDVTQASVSVTGYANNTTDYFAVLTGARLTAADTVTLYRGRSLSDRAYAFEVVEWPAAAGGEGATEGTSTEALPLSGAASAAVDIGGASSQPLGLGGGAGGAAEVASASAQALSLGGSATGAVTAHAATLQALPLGGSGAGAGEVAVASTQAVPLSGAVGVAVTVEAASTSALPFGGSAAAGVALTATSAQGLPLGGSAAMQVTVTGQALVPVPLGGSATGETGETPGGGVSVQALPLGGGGAGALTVRGASSRRSPWGGEAVGRLSLVGASTRQLQLGGMASGALAFDLSRMDVSVTHALDCGVEMAHVLSIDPEVQSLMQLSIALSPKE